MTPLFFAPTIFGAAGLHLQTTKNDIDLIWQVACWLCLVFTVCYYYPGVTECIQTTRINHSNTDDTKEGHNQHVPCHITEYIIIRGRPLMIQGGAGENFRHEFIFSREPFPYKFFSSARPLKISLFVQNGLQNNFFLGKGLPNLFFSEESPKLYFPAKCLVKFIFSWRVPLKMYFFLEKGMCV